ncbi:hypothetical protein [Stieleria mannarensis]|uniref:hypothetical protein n=1 Tax=Stieleria mannarensis TaxID=2755585 RepID=UPI0015FF724D|nr:hypothetical protein [Rhodopirellula sp. JC639]
MSLSRVLGDVHRSPIDETVNPYAASTSYANDTPVVDPKNPAKPLLILVGTLYAATGPLTILSGLQAGLHLIAAGFAMLILGCATIWLGMRDFTPAFRNLTIGWGCCLAAFFAWASFSAYDPSDLGGSIFFGVVLIAVTPIPILAFRQSARHHVNSAEAGRDGEPADAREPPS